MKKIYLFVAAVAAVAIGCTNEMLDTSYENAISEARLKGEHPLVFNAYVGNSMRQTRTVLENEQYATDKDQVNNGFYKYHDYSSSSDVPFEAIQNAYGIFAYVYNGEDNGEEVTMDDYFPVAYPENSDDVYASSHWISDITSTSKKAITPNFMYNTMIGSENKLYAYNEDEGGYYDPSDSENYKEVTMYWPTADYSMSEAPRISFFAYYPHVNPYHPDYNSSRNPLHISSEAQSGAPILDYKVATYADDLIPIDLMVAVPVLDKKYDTADGADNSISLNFGHLLSAVHVNLHYKSDISGTQPTFYFTKLSLQGADDKGKVTSKSMFRNRGRFNMAQGGWNCTGYDPLDLLSSSWLLNAKHDDGGSNVDGFVPSNGDTWYSLFGSNPLGPNESDPNPNYYMTSTWMDNPYTDTDTKTMLNQSTNQNGFMFIIPNHNAQKLLLDLAYTVDYGGGKFENIEVQKVIDNNGGPEFMPGKVYYFTIEIEKKSMTFDCDINIHNWTWGMTTTP